MMTSLVQREIDDLIRAHLATARQLVPMSDGRPIRTSSGFGAQAARVEMVVGEWVAAEVVAVGSIDVTVEALDEPFFTKSVDHVFAAGDSYRLTIPLA